MPSALPPAMIAPLDRLGTLRVAVAHAPRAAPLRSHEAAVQAALAAVGWPRTCCRRWCAWPPPTSTPAWPPATAAVRAVTSACAGTVGARARCSPPVLHGRGPVRGSTAAAAARA